MQNTHLKHISSLLLATLFISTSGVLGKYIALSPTAIVWFRSCFATLFILLFCRFTKVDLRIKSKKDFLTFLLSAIFMAGHWVTYFYALKLSNVALGMLSLYTFPVMTAFLEPLFLKTRLNPTHILLGIIVLLGLYILAPEFTLANTDVKGILFGLFSALCYALRILILKPHVANYNSSMLMFYQTLLITVFLIPALFYFDLSGFESQFPYLILIALLTTAIGHTLLVNSLNHFSVTTSSIISSIQPIFGIIIAFIFVAEIPTSNTYLGGALILSTVIIESFRSTKK